MSIREYPERPIVGVGAIVFEQDRVLLIQRGYAPMQGEWSIPGGGLEIGETLEEGIRREVLEETGLHVDPIARVEVLDRIARDTAGRIQYHYVLIDYLCRVTGGNIACGSDAVDVRWAKISELDGIASFTCEVIAKAWNIHTAMQ